MNYHRTVIIFPFQTVNDTKKLQPFKCYNILAIHRGWNLDRFAFGMQRNQHAALLETQIFMQTFKNVKRVSLTLSHFREKKSRYSFFSPFLFRIRTGTWLV